MYPLKPSRLKISSVLHESYNIYNVIVNVFSSWCEIIVNSNMRMRQKYFKYFVEMLLVVQRYWWSFWTRTEDHWEVKLKNSFYKKSLEWNICLQWRLFLCGWFARFNWRIGIAINKRSRRLVFTMFVLAGSIDNSHFSLLCRQLFLTILKGKKHTV